MGEPSGCSDSSYPMEFILEIKPLPPSLCRLALGIFIVCLLLTRYVSLGSVWAGVSFPFITWICYPEPAIVVLSVLCGGLVVYMHRANIKRLLTGTENKFSLRKKKS